MLVFEFSVENSGVVFEMLGAAFSILGAICGLIWKFIIKPNKDFRADVLSRLTKIEGRLEVAEEDIDEQEDNISKNVDKEIKNLKEIHSTLREDMNNHVKRLESRNEKILDTIVKYFMDKD